MKKVTCTISVNLLLYNTMEKYEIQICFEGSIVDSMILEVSSEREANSEALKFFHEVIDSCLTYNVIKYENNL